MSETSTKRTKTSMELDQEYHDAVLKVPDGLGVAQGTVTKEMVLTDRELFTVTFSHNFLCVVSHLYLFQL